MGYYMRFFDTSEELLSIHEIEKGLKEKDSTFRVDVPKSGTETAGVLYRGDDLYAEIEINQPGDGLFDSEIQEMLEFLEDDAPGEGRDRVKCTLTGTKRIISLRVVHQDRDPEETFDGLNNLWKLLFATRKGVLQADGEGYYDEGGLILEEGW